LDIHFWYLRGKRTAFFGYDIKGKAYNPGAPHSFKCIIFAAKNAWVLKN